MTQDNLPDENNGLLCHLVFFDEDLHDCFKSEVRMRLERILSNGFHKGHILEIRFGNIQTLDKSVIGEIMAAAKKAREIGGDAQFTTTNRYVKGKIEMLGFDKVVKIVSPSSF